ncbi:MAG: radical SAM protein [Pseudomonadota bacterium]
MGPVVSPGMFTPDPDTGTLLTETHLNRPPVKLMFSLIGLCNLDCMHCAGPAKDPATPSLELIDWVVDGLIPNIRAVRLGGNDNTEQLLSPKLLYFLDRVATKPQLQHFTMVTNLSVIDPALADAIAGQLTLLELSIEGTGANYETVRGFSWDRFVSHIEMLNAARDRNPESRLKLQLDICSMLSYLEDALEVERFRDWGVERIVLREFGSRGKPGHAENLLSRDPDRVARFLERFKEKCEQLSMRYVITYENRFSPQRISLQPTSAAAATPAKPAAAAAPSKAVAEQMLPDCHQPWEIISISHRGEVSACCRYPFWAEPELVSKTIDAAWNSASFRNLRSRVNTPELEDACRRCEFKHR